MPSARQQSHLIFIQRRVRRHPIPTDVRIASIYVHEYTKAKAKGEERWGRMGTEFTGYLEAKYKQLDGSA